MAALLVQVYVAETGYIFSRASVPKHAILSHLAGIPIPDLTAFARVRISMLLVPGGVRVHCGCL